MTALFEVMWLETGVFSTVRPSPVQSSPRSKIQSGYLLIFTVPDCRASAWASPCPSPLDSDTRYHSSYFNGKWTVPVKSSRPAWQHEPGPWPMAHDAPPSQKSTAPPRVDLPTPVKNRQFGITPTLFCPPKPLGLGPSPHIRCNYNIFLLYILINLPALFPPESSRRTFPEHSSLCLWSKAP